jgi:hypothetical protein
MASPLSICLPKRVRTIAIAGLSEILLAPFSVLSAAPAKAPAAPADTRAGGMVLFVAADALVDSVLARQHGGCPGSITVATMPETASHEHSVSLWDELARPAPAPLPVPIDAADTAKSNAAS